MCKFYTMGTLDKIFSEDNLLSYSRVCLSLAEDIPEYKNMMGRDFDTFVIPSRGAFPFFVGMMYGLDKLRELGGSHEDFYSRLAVPKMLDSLLPKGISERERSKKYPIHVLPIPFTADLNVEKYDPLMDNSKITLKTRQYWSHVTNAFFKKPRQRLKDPYFRSFTNFILRDVENRDDLAKFYEQFPTIEKFSMLDTVISGRASNNILSTFDEIAKKEGNPDIAPTAYLIVDEDGKKLSPAFRPLLMRKRSEGGVFLYNTPLTVSEDEGASLLGVAAVIYPSIMRLSQGFCLGKDEFFIGAGSWHRSKDLPSPYYENFKSFMNVIYRGIDSIFGPEYLCASEGKRERQNFLEARESFLERAKRVNILNETSDHVSVLNPSHKYGYDSNYETSSHVLHAPFNTEGEGRAYAQISGLPGVRSKKEK